MKETDYYKSGKQQTNVKLAREKATLVQQKMKQKRIDDYNAHPKLCNQCSNAIDYDHRKNKFCSQSCAASFNNKGKVKTEATKEKISASNIKNFTDIKYCKQCDKVFAIKRRSYTKNYCSSECRNSSPIYKQNISDRMKKRVAEGKHIGWLSRAKVKRSYPELYFEKLFANEGYAFEPEVPCGRFFIDFVIGKHAIEIDGKQHEYPEQVQRDIRKDLMMKEKGYIVTRIKWFNPINEPNKNRLYPQIKELLNLLKEVK